MHARLFMYNIRILICAISKYIMLTAPSYLSNVAAARKRSHQWCLTLTPNSTETIERIIYHRFLRPIRRPYKQPLRTPISYLCWCPFEICNNLVEATAGLQRDVTAAVLVIKNKGDSLLWRQKFPCKFFEKKKTFYCIDMTTNMAALSHGCKPRIAGDY